MRRDISLYFITLLGISAVVVITQALDQQQKFSVIADLPSNIRESDISYAAGVEEFGEDLSGGAATVRDTGVHAFGRVPMNLTSYDTNWLYFREGRKIFERNWYIVKQGRLLLGPQFNAPSCKSCHQFDGRGRPPINNEKEDVSSLIVRLSIPHGTGTIPEPTYGEQLSYYAVADSVAPEGAIRISYEEIQGRFSDGSNYALRMPSYEFLNLGYGPLAPDVQSSPRVAPATFGLGLLEAIPEQSILALADPDDRNGDGISGRPNYVQDYRTGQEILGRFGWKANQPTVEQQIFKAFHADMGITSPAYQDDNPLWRPTGNTTDVQPELEDKEFDALLFYMKLLAVPARRDWKNSTVLRGKTIFRSIGCAGCHAPQFVTGTMQGYPELSNQTIRPYTDMLLHDMGEGLADNRPDGRANGREWRTPPLWGIGLIKTVNEHTFFLHDGRARNLEEAVLWHGGEAEAAQNHYRRLRRDDRNALLAFLESL